MPSPWMQGSQPPGDWLEGSVAKEWFDRRRAAIRPWAGFVDQRKFSKPRNFAELCQRVLRNLDNYQSNYIFIFLGLILYCIISSPMLLVALAVFVGAFYIIHLRSLESKLVVFGRELTGGHQMGLAGASNGHAVMALGPARDEERSSESARCATLVGLTASCQSALLASFLRRRTLWRVESDHSRFVAQPRARATLAVIGSHAAFHELEGADVEELLMEPV
ncbi:hypothetical protein JZ751_028243 [Albula glossodonta]|uniref:PRA1 family protein n=1 Tax=Albula glossodonta TaxID=121402 RepID=A0A8T2ND45_9TELE|nr:hypothetical protein JZ751_028243 [Albula glossodonta]